MAAPDPQALKKRWERMEADQATWRTNWQELADYLLPRKNNITRTITPGEKQTDRLFDSTGVRAPELLAASLAGVLVSPAQKWFGLTARQQELNDIKRVRDWLEDTTLRTYRALGNSNFYSEIREVLLDVDVFGTASMLMDENPYDRRLNRWPGLRCKALSIPEYTISEGADGRVDTLFRKFKMTNKQVMEQWPSTASDSVVRALERNPDAAVEILHAVYPRYDRKMDRIDGPNKAYASCYLQYKEAHLLREGGYDEFPYLVPRWAKTSGEVYGRGPGFTAIPDIRTLNRLRELELSAGAKAVDPVLLQVDDGIVGSISLEPASINVVREKGALEALKHEGNWTVAEWLDGRLRDSINAIFFIDLFKLRDDPKMTATQFLGLQEEMWRLLGPTAGRLQSELLSPLIERAIKMQFRAGALREPPRELLEGGDIDIEFEGPLARAQKGLDLVAIDRTNMYLSSVTPMHPEVGDLFDFDRQAKYYANTSGMPSDLLRDESMVAQMRQGRLQAQQNIQKLQTLKDSAKPIKDLAQAGKAANEAGVDVTGGQAQVPAEPAA